MNNLALVLGRQGKYAEAETMHRQELAVCKKVLGAEHPDMLESMNNLALVLDSQGKYAEAINLYERTYAGSPNFLERNTRTHAYAMKATLMCLHRRDKAGPRAFLRYWSLIKAWAGA
jgi:tetratricopeptide (TPR) repeat protein